MGCLIHAQGRKLVLVDEVPVSYGSIVTGEEWLEELGEENDDETLQDIY